MFGTWLASIKHIGMAILEKVQAWIIAKTKPVTDSQVLETARDLLRPKAELVAENALLRQQLIVLKRGVKQPKLTHRDRWPMVVLAEIFIREWRGKRVQVKWKDDQMPILPTGRAAGQNRLQSVG